VAFLIGSCSRGAEPPEKKGSNILFEFSSPAFVNGAALPGKYTCYGENVSPPLKWSGIPEGTKSLALIYQDPGAPKGSQVLWMVYSIPPSIMELPEGIQAIGILSNGAKQGRNDFNEFGYKGPCPPEGKVTRSIFKLYALDHAPKLPPGISEKELISVVEGHHLAEKQLMVTCQKE
jgi:hypothetical protein